MKRFIFFSMMISFSFFIACNEDNIVPLEPMPVCEMFFKDTSFYKNINGTEYLVYRICAKNDYRNEIFLFEDIGYMSEKKQYLFLDDTINNCVFVDLYERADWISSDEFRFYLDYKSKAKGTPEQTLVLGKYYSINSCGSEWTIKFRTPSNPRESFYFDVQGVAESLAEPIEANGFKTITIKKTKDSPFKAGQSVRCFFGGISHPEVLKLP